MKEEVPQGLTALEYARHLLEFELSWPAKGNLELISDCITSLSKGKKLSLVQAYKYLVRAVRIAKEQGQTVDYFWFQRGQYTSVRPKFELIPKFKAPTAEEREALRREQASPEYKAMVAKMDKLLRDISQRSRM
jgi:hypothetical protein